MTEKQNVLKDYAILNMYNKIKNYGPLSLKIAKEIHMGYTDSSDICEFINERYLRIDKEGKIFIKDGIIVEAGYVHSNGWIEIRFPDLKSRHDIAFDDLEDYDLYFCDKFKEDK